MESGPHHLEHRFRTGSAKVITIVTLSLHIGPVIGFNIYKRIDPLEKENLGK